MEATSYIALSRQTGLRRQMDIVANNLANMNTSGFKGEKIMFIEHLAKSKGGHRPIAEQVAYTRDIATVRDLSGGELETTGNPFDLAVTGDGYFVIQTDQGNQYTRNGRFRLDQGGQMVNQQGHPVLTDGGQPLFFAPGETSITIAPDGTVATENGELGKLALVNFANPQQLRPGAGSLFATEQEPEAVENPNVMQGMLESSNVLPIIEMSKMIDVHRTYESVKNMIEREDDRMRNTIRELAKVG